MKFEKLNENKIRITLNTQDLIEKNIDFHSFMSNSQETQSLFMDVLAEAERKVGFITKDYKLRIEALAMSDGNFILTVTRFGKNNDINIKSPQNQHLRVSRKRLDMNSSTLVYKFDSFDDFCNFSNVASNLEDFYTIAKSLVLYYYENAYYLCFNTINTNHKSLEKLYMLITEFGTYISNSEVLYRQLSECGKVVMKNNAVRTSVKFFS